MKIDEEKLLTVEQVAAFLQVKSSWVYGHSEELGAIRLGKYLRFYWPKVLEKLTQIVRSPTQRPNSSGPHSSTCKE